MKRICSAIFLISLVFLIPISTRAADVMLRVGRGTVSDYINNPASYPVCKEKMDYICFDSHPNADELQIWDSDDVFFVMGTYGVGQEFTPGNTIDRIRSYEAAGKTVKAIWFYRENWLDDRDTAGPYPIDRRILAPHEIAGMRAGIQNANPPLACKDTVKLVQLLGGRTWGEKHGDSWLTFSDETKAYLRDNFDGVGTECHIGDHDETTLQDAQNTLRTMADITKWAEENGKMSFVFMGGGPHTYEDHPYNRDTYRFLWNEMDKLGVDYKSDFITYFRQGARGGNMVPEATTNTLTHQMRWLLNAVQDNDSAIESVSSLTIPQNGTKSIPLTLGAEFEPYNVTWSIDSSNSTLLPNANILLKGTGANRTLILEPVMSQTGSTTITLTSTLAPLTQSTTIDVTVAVPSVYTATSSGTLNASATWGGASPALEDANKWQSGANTLSMATGTASFDGSHLILQSGGQLAPGVPGAELTLNALTLDGGEIYMGNNLGLLIDGQSQTFTLNSGTLRSGNDAGRSIRFANVRLAGSGAISVTSATTLDADVRFLASVDTTGFTGSFEVTDNGRLYLPAIAPENASFGLTLSGSGKYANNTAVAVTHLTLNGNAISSGSTYSYSDFTVPQQALIGNNGGSITVTGNTAPTLSAVGNQTTAEDTATGTIPFTIGDELTAPSNLVVEVFSSDTLLVSDAQISLSGTSVSRSISILPNENQSGTATLTVRVSDGVNQTSESFDLTVTAQNDAPAITSIENQLTDGSLAITNTFTVADPESPTSSLVVTKASSNAMLVPAGNIVITGAGEEKTVIVTPVAGQTGSTVITLTVSDGLLNTSTSFVFAVVAGGSSIPAAATGAINDATTWSIGMAPLKGDTYAWGSGTQQLELSGSRVTRFHGNTLEIEAGGTLITQTYRPTFELKNLILNGGEISVVNNGGLFMDLTGHTFTLQSGTIQSGQTDATRDISFSNAKLAGSGTVHIVSMGTAGAEVEFEHSIDTTGFSGTLSVHDNGLLHLPPIANNTGSFTLSLSGTGKYWNDSKIAVSGLEIDGIPFGSGTYSYSDFSPVHQAFLFNNGGTIRVEASNLNPPTIGAIPDLTTRERTSAAAAFTVDDADGAYGLSVTGASANTTLIPNNQIITAGTGTNRTVSVTPAYGQTGSTIITLVVSDGTYQATNSFMVTVTPDPDTDGDGMGDATETEQGRNPNSAADLGFEFNTDGAFDGWGNFNNISSPTVSDGTLSGTGTGDAQFSQANFQFPANDAPYMIIKFKTASASTLQFFWGHTTAGGFAGTRRFDMPYSASANWQAIIVPTSTHADWAGKIITALRIDPATSSGVSFEIDWIRASDGDLDDDGISDADEGTGDTNGDGLLDLEEPNGAYEQWAFLNGVSGEKMADADDDGLSNIYEYGLGGNPTNGVVDGYLPTLTVFSNTCEYVHPERSGVTYTVVASTNLVTGGWSTNHIERVGVGTFDGTYKAVTNRLEIQIQQQFIRLIIE